MSLNRRIHVFIKRRLPRHLRRTRNIFFISFTSCAFVGLLCISAWMYWMDKNTSAASALLTAGAVALSVLIWRITGSTLYGGLVYQPALMGLILFNAAITGGVTSPALTWLGIIPLLPLFTGARFWAMVWMGLSFLSVIMLYALQIHGYMPMDNTASLSAAGDPSWQNMAFGAVMFSLMLLAQIVLVQTYDTAYEQQLRRLRQGNHRLEVLSRNLQVANAHKDQFLAMVSHEMRTPLNAVMGYLGLLISDKQLPNTSVEYAQGASDSAAHLVTVINDLLDFSQIQQGKLVLSLQAVNLRDLLTSTHQTLSPRAKQQGLEYTVRLDSNLPEWAMVDPHRLTQIMLNLLGNALKFTTSGGVQLHASFEATAAQHGMLCLSVQDTGRGIPASSLNDIFKPFVQLQASDNHLRQGNALHGNGLGLAITRSLVQSHKGTLSVTSQEGQGSTFTVKLPIDVAAAPATRRNADITTHPAAVDLLVVDDHATNRLVASATIMRGLPNASVDHAVNGTEALEKMRRHRYDLVLMDLIMPDLSGTEVVQRIRQEAPPPLCDVPVVALTANLAEDAVKECLRLGFKEVLPKPFTREALLQAIVQHALPAAATDRAL